MAPIADMLAPVSGKSMCIEWAGVAAGISISAIRARQSCNAPSCAPCLVIPNDAYPFVLLRAQQGNLTGDGMAFAAAVPAADDNAAAAVGQ